jgi:hypothetical protein
MDIKALHRAAIIAGLATRTVPRAWTDDRS